MKAAADLVEHAAGRHAVQRAQRKPSEPGQPRHAAVPEQERDARGVGELWGRAEPAVVLVGHVQQVDGGLVGRGPVECGSPRGRRAGRLGPPHSLDELFGVGGHVGAVLGPRLRKPPHDASKAAPPPHVRWRKVRAGVERLLVRREEHAQRPAALSGGHLARLLVHVVDVGALLAIDLYGHEMLVEQGRYRLVLERLVGHYVAPVARAVPHAQKDRLVLPLGPLQGRVVPGMPPHGVRGVLEQVGAGLEA